MGLLNRGKVSVHPGHDYTLLLLEVPRTNDKKELAAEQMLASLHGILRSKKELRRSSSLQEHISLEVAAIGQRLRFYIWAPKQLQAFVEGQIYAQYPTVQIYEQEEDYSERRLHQSVIHSSELTLTDNETLPIKTFPNFEVDPLAAITATLAKLDKEDEEMWIQMITRPIPDDWHRRGQKMVDRIKRGGGVLGGGSGGSAVSYAAQMLGALSKPPEAGLGVPGTPAELPERDKSRITAIQEKSTKLGYQVKIRIMYAGHDQHTARLRMQALVGAFKQFNTTNLNGFEVKHQSFDRDKQLEYQARFFIDHGFILNIEELASLFHLPHTTVETPNIVWATTKTAEPPPNIPVQVVGNERDISLFGVTNFRGDNTVFGLNREDRGRHVYLLGQTGTGKSGALELLTLSDIYYDQGFAVIDPHGDYAQNVLSFIPPRRVDDVVYFNPADSDYPIGFNPLEVGDPSLKGHVSSELVGVLKRLFAESWGPRLEYILRYTLLALLDYPNSTMLDITRMLTDRKFRDLVITHIDDPVVKNFWITEFASWNERFATEAVAPVLNKVGAFTANPMVRNIIGQPKSTFNLRQIMDQGKILIVNLSRGLMGEDNAGILGAMMVTKIQLSAMGRANVPQEQRRPFYLYVDEFQNFATDSFAAILSEARKYNLFLTVANQYISQMSEPVRDAVFGNVGTIITFRVSPDDAPFLKKYFEPQFEEADLIAQHSRYFVITMMINGEKAPPFSAKTLNLPLPAQDSSTQIIELSRQRYAQERPVVEDIVRRAAGLAMDRQQNQPKKPQPPAAPAPKSASPPAHPERPSDIGKLAAGSLSAAEQPQSATKRRRRRSRRKPPAQSSTSPTGQAKPQAPISADSQEMVIRLR
ncbi:hypothetical protein A3E49_03605 [Candidatus Saccharibacteria bacterium RIFCSPHIGHO2_12_FULL_49_19]|nr:MAG: hypothetical protein A2708_02605 [Candidatus Saccharibacteria bacterium RIFCSPHIGHO2_01_FULL_49_21]OGL36229.1 MAG: hypothetical protein A3E49_03605 [Candidatus Saccharibacteria bacterium RIFCSPHIGHO2_12_FULL_49_19]OGL37329.1 MAG: hypothetical protein A3B63_02130 [Candidatus Saccharibacteria bacterium RIFCSPLOWO2_01_FULL_49_22]